MSSTYRIGIAGLTHGHFWNLLDAFSKHPNVNLVAVAESDPIVDRVEFPFEHRYTDWREMLEKESLDGLIVTSDNKTSADIAEAALLKGIPCLVEKAMARNAADADRMLAAAEKSGKTLMINWPIRWQPWLCSLHDHLETDEIGQVFHFKMRMGHRGPKEIGCGAEFYGWLYNEELNGGGAIADFCGYGAVVARWLFGMPETVYGLRGNLTKDYDVPDDHALCVLKYPKMTAILEGTWATNGFDPSGNPVIHGSDGTLSVFDGKMQLNKGSDSRLAEAATRGIPDPASYFIECIEGKLSPEGILDPVIAADACRIIDAAKASAVSGCAVKPQVRGRATDKVT